MRNAAHRGAQQGRDDHGHHAWLGLGLGLGLDSGHHTVGEAY